MLVTWYDFLCHSDVTSLPPLYRYPLSIAWLRVRVARYTHPVYSPSGICHSDVTSLPPLYRYPLSIAWLRVRVAWYTFLFSLAWPWRTKSLVKHNMLKKRNSICSVYPWRDIFEEFSYRRVRWTYLCVGLRQKSSFMVWVITEACCAFWSLVCSKCSLNIHKHSSCYDRLCAKSTFACNKIMWEFSNTKREC